MNRAKQESSSFVRERCKRGLTVLTEVGE